MEKEKMDKVIVNEGGSFIGASKEELGFSNQITPDFYATFQSILNLQKVLKIHCILSCILFFPFGFLTLPAFMPNPRFSLSLSMNILLSFLSALALFLLLIFSFAAYCPGQCPATSSAFIFSWIYSGLLIVFFVTGAIFAGMGNLSEKMLLRQNPSLFLQLLQNSPSITPLSPSDIICRKISVLGRQLRGFTIYFSIAWFPFGLLFLFGLKGRYGIHSVRMMVFSAIAILGHVFWIYFFVTNQFLVFFAFFPVFSFVVLAVFFALVFKYEAFERSLRGDEKSFSSFSSWMNSNQDPLFNAWNF